MKENKQAHIYYVGTVQGVGFRYTTRSFAVELTLSGWVRNLADGRVEIMVEGTQDDIDKLCQRLEEQFEGHILNKTIEWNNATGKFGEFQVTH